MKYILLICLFMIVGCQSSTKTLSPTDAGIHTLYYEYWENGKWHRTKGIGGAVINGGTDRRIRVLIPRKAEGNLFITDDGNDLLNYPVKGEKWVEIQLGDMPVNTKTNTIGLSLATKNYSVSTARFYGVGNLNVTDPLDISYQCPYKKDHGPISVCTRPAGFNFFLTVKIREESVGKMRITTKGICEVEEEFYVIEGGEDFYIKFSNNGESGYCNIRIDTRQNQVGNEWTVKKFREVNVNYFKAEYIMLGAPIISGSPGAWRFYPTDEYKSYYLNGKHYKARSKKEFKLKDPSVYLVMWDKYGRVVYVERK